MKDDTEKEKLLVRYLLGNLTEEEQLQVEKMFLSDDLCYERLLTLENELFYDYAQGKLSPGERERFEKRFLTSEYNRRRATLAAALSQKMSETSIETIELGLADRRPLSWWQSLHSYFKHQSLAVRFSLPAFAIVLLGSTWLISEILGLRVELARLRKQRADLEGAPQQQERARADELNLRLQRELEENSRLKAELGKLQRRPREPEQKLPAVASFRLTPSLTESEAVRPKRVYVPRGTRLVRFRLRLKPEALYQSYQVMLLAADGSERWSRDRLRVRRTRSGRNLVMRLPARLLGKGGYELRLKGLAADGTPEEVEDRYYFKLIK